METYLLREIAARSDNFFEAAGVVQDLRGAVGRAFEDVKGLRRTVWMLWWHPVEGTCAMGEAYKSITS